jgi:hypothetical protein
VERSDHGLSGAVRSCTPDTLGFDDLPANVGPTSSEMDRMIQTLPRSRRTGRIAAFMKDERDTARPEALVAMLAKV